MIANKLPGYHDVGGRIWPTAKLDALLAQPEVMQTVRQGLTISRGPRGDFWPAIAYTWARDRYRRTECSDLLHILVVRLRDREERDAA